MPGFKASKDRLTLLLGVNRVGNLKLKAVLVYYFENSKILMNDAKPTLPVLYKWSIKVWMEQRHARAFTHLFSTTVC